MVIINANNKLMVEKTKVSQFFLNNEQIYAILIFFKIIKYPLFYKSLKKVTELLSVNFISYVI